MKPTDPKSLTESAAGVFTSYAQKLVTAIIRRRLELA